MRLQKFVLIFNKDSILAGMVEKEYAVCSDMTFKLDLKLRSKNLNRKFQQSNIF